MISCSLAWCVALLFFFFFNDTATTEIYTLSLHDALPICAARGSRAGGGDRQALQDRRHVARVDQPRSEEHTSELQSQSNLVCRLLLEKKKIKTPIVQRVELAHSDRVRDFVLLAVGCAAYA